MYELVLPLPQPLSGMIKMDRKIGYLFFILLVGLQLDAQQLAQYSTWLNNSYLYNPAVAGQDETLVANGIYRSQWVDFEGAPVSQHLDASIPFRIINSGLGIKLDNELIGPHQTSQFLMSYSYQRWIGNSGKLSVGLSAGMQQYVLDGRILRAPQGSYQDPTFQHNDQWLPEGRISAAAPVAELGVYYSMSNWDIGVSTLPVFAPELNKSQADGRFRLKPERHYLAQVNYNKSLGEEAVLTAGGLVKSDGRSVQVEFAAQVYWREKLRFGAGYRGVTATARDALIAFIGMRLNEKASFVYAYDVPISGLSSVNRGSHEICLQYRLGQPIGEGKLPPVIYNPRFR